MICHVCGRTIIFYAHQHVVAAALVFFHPECCPDCPERHRVGGAR